MGKHFKTIQKLIKQTGLEKQFKELLAGSQAAYHEISDAFEAVKAKALYRFAKAPSVQLL